MTTTPIGRLLLIYGALSLIVGYLILIKFADVVNFIHHSIEAVD